jgi:predicted PhzF superfamily epimerase YddE/YHI9
MILGEGVWIVDAFTDKPFKGNAAAVTILNAFPDAPVMQLIAAQMNLSETAFLVKTGPQEYDLRWFTPTQEVTICGHATLAATHVLLQSGRIKTGNTVTYNTLSGKLTARSNGKKIEMDFPALPGEETKPPTLLKHLEVPMVACQRNRDNYLVEVKDFATLTGCQPSFKKLAKLDAEGVIVTTATGVPAGYDFASRYFAPGLGIDEDPVTGSAHCFLAPYWTKKLGKTSFHCFQASKGEGVLDVTLAGDRVLIAGTAVTTLKGHLPLTQGVA